MTEAQLAENLPQQLQGDLERVPPPKGRGRAQGLFMGEKNPHIANPSHVQATIQISLQKEEVSFKQI